MSVRGAVVQRPWVKHAASILLFGCGLALLKFCVFDVLAKAERGEHSVSVSLKGIVVAPMLIVLGLTATVGTFLGNRAPNLTERFTSPQTKKLTPLGWGVVAVLIAVGGGLYFWVRGRLTDLGYDV